MTDECGYVGESERATYRVQLFDRYKWIIDEYDVHDALEEDVHMLAQADIGRVTVFRQGVAKTYKVIRLEEPDEQEAETTSS